MIAQGLPVSASLGILALAWAMVLGISAGVIAAIRRGKQLDATVMAIATIGIAVPNFVVAAILLILFAFVWPILPVVFLALGGVATQSLLGTREPIGKLRGRVHPYGSAVLIPTFHPAFLLRNPGDEYKRMAWEDLQLARREYDRRRTR